MKERDIICSCQKPHSALAHNLLWFQVLYIFSCNISILTTHSSSIFKRDDQVFLSHHEVS